MKIFVERLKELRIEQAKTQKEIADQLKIPQRTYSNYEQGKAEPDLELLSAIADVLETSTDYLPWQNAKPARGSYADGSRTTLRQSSVRSQAYRDTISAIFACNQPKIKTIRQNQPRRPHKSPIFYLSFSQSYLLIRIAKIRQSSP